MTVCPPRLVVLTGGPGAGKTAVLEMAQLQFCHHVVVLPESASLLFKGGFPREDSGEGRACAQRAILLVQQQLERLALARPDVRVVLCDRGTLDGLAYWRGAPLDLLHEGRTTREAELARYATVIHLRVPSADRFNRQSNPLRTEDAEEAAAIDSRIERAWDGHPHRSFVPSSNGFLHKARRALDLIRAEFPPDCLNHLGNGAEATKGGP